MNNTLWILKLGGAAITDKTSEYTLREEVIKQTFDQLKNFTDKLIIVHGAGSFAHNLAKKYRLSKGRAPDLSPREQYEGIVKTRRSLQNLHNAILDYSANSGLLPFSFPVSAIFVSENEDELESKYLSSLEKALKYGFNPILYGDISFDNSNEFRVISGDRIIKELSKYFKKQFNSIRILFGTNVDGIFDKDPDVEGAKLIPKFTLTQIDEMLEFVGESAGTDVTGGMKGKLEEIKSIVQLGHRVQIFNLTINKRLTNILQGNNEIMTDITPR